MTSDNAAADADSTVEAVIDPDLEICDPHFHLWAADNVTPPSSNGSWDMSGHQAYLLDDFITDARSGHNVTSAVFAECGSSFRPTGPEAFMPIGESELVANAAAESVRSGPPRIIAMVGMADLRLDALDDVLDAHVVASAGLIAGIRARVAYDPKRAEFMPAASQPDPELLRDPDFARGVRRLGERGLVLDVWIFHTQLAELADLARTVPATAINVNHLGVPLGVGPYRRTPDEVNTTWRSGMTRLAALDNVTVKLGGVGMYLLGHKWMTQPDKPTSDDIAATFGERIRFLIDTFGPRRCMFESNFPVDRAAASYRTLWNAFKKITTEYTPNERTELFRDTALRTYRPH